MGLDEGMTYSMPLEVYLQSAVVRGILGTNQDRLSNYFILRARRRGILSQRGNAGRSQPKTRGGEL